MFRKSISFVLSALVFVLLTLSFANPAEAAPNLDTLGVYIDAPFVQGSYVAAAAGVGTGWANFNVSTGANCASGFTLGTLTGDCRIDASGQYGGASAAANVATPTVAGVGSTYATTINTTSPITVSLSAENKYLGLWWSAGSPSNTIKFYQDNTLLLTMTTQDLMNVLGTAPSSNTDFANRNNDTGSNALTASDGSKYRKVRYFGNPRGYTSTSPTVRSTLTPAEPFLYLHMFAGGNFQFNKITLSGGGFEFDNLATSTQALTPATSLVNVETLYGNHTVHFDSNGTGVTGTTPDQTASAAQNLRANGFARPGYRFLGWNSQADGLGTTYSNAQSYDFSSSTTMYAKWESLNVTVSFHASNGQGIMSDQTGYSRASLNQHTFSRDGYVFTGWNTSADGRGTTYGEGDSYAFTANLDLYAQWEALAPSDVAVVFDSNGGSGEMSPQLGHSAAHLSSNTFMRPGYRFVGWTTSANGSGTVYSDAELYGFNAQLELFAKWEKASLPNTGNAGAEPWLGSLALALSGLAVVLWMRVRKS